jgi:hypothetical protein
MRCWKPRFPRSSMRGRALQGHRSGAGALPLSLHEMPATLEGDSDPGHPERSEKHIFVTSRKSPGDD